MYILSIFSILQIWANYNKNLCEKGDIYNFNEIVTIGFAEFILLMFDKIKTKVSGETGEAAAGGVDYPVSPHPASDAYPGW